MRGLSDTIGFVDSGPKDLEPVCGVGGLAQCLENIEAGLGLFPIAVADGVKELADLGGYRDAKLLRHRGHNFAAVGSELGDFESDDLLWIGRNARRVRAARASGQRLGGND